MVQRSVYTVLVLNWAFAIGHKKTFFLVRFAVLVKKLNEIERNAIFVKKKLSIELLSIRFDSIRFDRTNRCRHFVSHSCIFASA